jgi:hypothetical protein
MLDARISVCAMLMCAITWSCGGEGNVGEFGGRDAQAAAEEDPSAAVAEVDPSAGTGGLDETELQEAVEEGERSAQQAMLPAPLMTSVRGLRAFACLLKLAELR